VKDLNFINILLIYQAEIRTSIIVTLNFTKHRKGTQMKSLIKNYIFIQLKKP